MYPLWQHHTECFTKNPLCSTYSSFLPSSFAPGKHWSFYCFHSFAFLEWPIVEIRPDLCPDNFIVLQKRRDRLVFNEYEYTQRNILTESDKKGIVQIKEWAKVNWEKFPLRSSPEMGSEFQFKVRDTVWRTGVLKLFLVHVIN